MAWEYKVLEPLDYGHPGAGARIENLSQELAEMSKEGWEVVQMLPGMARGRMVPGGKNTEQVNITTAGVIVLLRRQVE